MAKGACNASPPVTASKAKSAKGYIAKAASFSAFLKPERVKRKGGQNQLCERSTEKVYVKVKLEEEIEGKIPHGFSKIGAMLAGPNRQAQKRSKRPEGTWLRKRSPQSKK